MNNQHEARWNQWLADKAKPWFTAKRGRYAALSRHLGVSRQTVSRWFHGRRWGCTPVPGWAAVAMNIWLHEQWKAEAITVVVTPQAVNRFSRLEFEPHQQFVRRSADKLPVETPIVAGSADNVVTPQADEERRVIHIGRAA